MSEETTEAATVDETKAVAPAPDVPPVVVRRQSLATRMGVCDMRVGVGATAQLGEALRGVVGKPRRVLVAHSADVPADVVEEARRSLVDTGFGFCSLELADGRAARNLDEATRAFEALASHGITADDAIVAVGDADLISTLVFVASTWCAGTVLAAVPTTLDGMVDVTVTPRALDVSAASEMLLAKGVVRLAVCDPANLPDAPDDPGTLMGRAVLVAGAVTAGETTFSELAVRADGIVAQDADTLVDEVLDITKSRSSPRLRPCPPHQRPRRPPPPAPQGLVQGPPQAQPPPTANRLTFPPTRIKKPSAPSASRARQPSSARSAPLPH